MFLAKHWTTDEINYLKEYYGSRNVKRISEDLGRTSNAVTQKANRLGLEMTTADEWLTIADFCLYTNLSRSTVEYWIRYCGFPTRLKRVYKKRYRIVDPFKFWKWAEQNKGRIQWNDLPKYAVQGEPGWVEVARKNNVERINKRRPWTVSEVNTLKFMLSKNKYTYADLSKELKRSHAAIKRKIYDLELMDLPVYMPKRSRQYTDDEVQRAVELYKTGVSMTVVARKLSRSEDGLRGKIERSGYKFEGRNLVKL